MPTARDIALIFLSLEALVVALVPLAILSALAYGVYRLHRLARIYLQKAQLLAQQAHDYVAGASDSVTRPLIRAHAVGSQAATMVKKLTRRR
jgi:type II secretory pathway component PulK